ncbi:MAG TPA: fumarylacetoacetate hydrolase family protein [Micromonosporaceae bacterium]|jgi:2-keto-4-pentenoate hydratase/2-oxohepta-3-ene-1,7-dioic acid hydratase in catechol pathway
MGTRLARWSGGLALHLDHDWYDLAALTSGDEEFGAAWWAAATASSEPVYRDLARLLDRVGSRPRPEPLDAAAVEAGLRTPVWGSGMIYCAALNYHSHVAESGGTAPDQPLFFLKPFRCLVDPGDGAALPRSSAQVDYEIELAVVIGRRGKAIAAADAYDHIAGYTVINDLSYRDLQIRQTATARTVDWVQGKALDSAAPIGPWVVPSGELADPGALDLTLTVNGEARQTINSSDMIFDIPTLIERLSADITLYPGDVIATGTGAGVGKYRRPGGEWLSAGDKLELTIAGIGTLSHGMTGGDR